MLSTLKGLNMIGDRIRQRRTSLGLSMQDVIDRLIKKDVKITRAGLSKYENNQSTPKARFLWELAKVLGVKNDYFFKEEEVSIEWVAFRKHTSLTKKMESQVKSYAQEVLEGQLFLEDIINPDKEYSPIKKHKISSPEEAEGVAEKIREVWRLDEWPIESMIQLLEDKSLYVIEYNTDEKKFDGLSGFLNGKNPIVITKKNVPEDRKRFNLAHELGHLVLDVDEEIEEQAAHRFAASFLFPKKCVIEEIGEDRRRIDIHELILLKEKYGISLQAIIRRCIDLNIISQGYYKSLSIEFSRRGWRTEEPGECRNFEEAIHFKQMVLKSLAEGIITEEKAIEIYPEYREMKEINEEKTNWRWRDMKKMSIEERNRILETAASSAQEDYKNNPELSAFNVNEDIDD